MPTQRLAISPKDNLMQFYKTIFKPLKEQEKQCRHINNLCLYCEKLGHNARECLKKRVPHATHAIYVTNPQLEQSRNENV
jgi:hypothetical protein